jgi:hypothetical protein
LKIEFIKNLCHSVDLKLLKDLKWITIKKNDDDEFYEIIFKIIIQKKEENLKLKVFFDKTKTCFCCNIKNIISDWESLKYCNKLKENIYYKKKIFKDEITKKEIVVKRFFEHFSFFDIFDSFNKEDIDRLDPVSYRIAWEKRPNSKKIVFLKMTFLINIILEVYPKVLMSTFKKNGFYDYKNDSVYKQITDIFKIEQINEKGGYKLNKELESN